MDERVRSILVKRFKIAWVGNKHYRCGEIMQKLDEKGRDQIKNWIAHQYE